MGKPRKHDCTTMKRLATQAKAKLGWRRQRDQLKLEMQCFDNLEPFVKTGRVAREATNRVPDDIVKKVL